MSDTFDRARALEENLARQIEAIRASDVKITLLVPTCTAMIGVVISSRRVRPRGAPSSGALGVGMSRNRNRNDPNTLVRITAR